MVTIGDRLLRAGNTRRAAQRHERAIRTESNSSDPRIRLSQIALLRGQYDKAASHYRKAIFAEPGWLAKAFDIESIFSEPGDYARRIARLELYLQVSPGDQDTWLVLGAQRFLSGWSGQVSPTRRARA
ncbi:MAG: hypothetical protein JO116_10850 [Planctomycetaceae bacterium]|nr:hypothetical protein [Planctomycetaceae bacterium]